MCILEGCNKAIYARGLCHYHYYLVNYVIKRRKRSWQEFEDVGMSLPLCANTKNRKLEAKLDKKLFKKDERRKLPRVDEKKRKKHV